MQWSNMRVTSALFARSVWKGVFAYTSPQCIKLTDYNRTTYRTVCHTTTLIRNLALSAVGCTNFYQSLPIIRPKPGERAPPIKTQARSATILPNFVGLIFQVHNGKIYHDVRITEDMVGHKLGEFSPYVWLVANQQWKSLTLRESTRKRFTYKQTKNK